MSRGKIIPTLESVPFELRRLGKDGMRWVLWKFVEREGKMTKLPVQPNGHNARANDPSTWGYCESLLRSLKVSYGVHGIGVMLGGGLVGIDIDTAFDDQNVLLPWVADLVTRMNSYTEKSPSGKGIHILVRTTAELVSHRNSRVEFYSGNRFFTFTGVRLPNMPMSAVDATDELTKWHNEEFPPDPAVAQLVERLKKQPTKIEDPHNFDPELLKQFEEDASQPPSFHLTPDLMPEYWEWQDLHALRRCMSNSNDPAKFARLFRGEKSDFGGDWSRCDLALCSDLMWACDGYVEQADRMFRQSGLMRKKWLRKDYREDLTLYKAWAGYIEREANGRQQAYDWWKGTPQSAGEGTEAREVPSCPF